MGRFVNYWHMGGRERNLGPAASLKDAVSEAEGKTEDIVKKA
jgi:hypothetical protein